MTTKFEMEVFLYIFVIAISIQHGLSQGTKRCDVPADVVFLMDSSDSIKAPEWEQEKDFVAALIDKLEVARYAIHVGVIVYSTNIGPIIDLQPFKTKAQLKDLLEKAGHISQGTDTAKGLSKLIEMSYNQGRLDAKQIAVVITDGRSTDVAETKREATRARTEYNIDIIALGVGNETFLEELKDMTGPTNTDRLFQVQTFNQLLGVEAELERLICEIIPPTTTTTEATTQTTATSPSTTSPYLPPFPCSEEADVVFLIDGSYSITAEDWVKGKQFVSYLINGLDIGRTSINVGIVVYSSAVGDVVNLRPFRSKTELREAASGLIQPPVGRTNTALGLQTVRDMIRTQARPGVPHITIVITDGMSSNPSRTRSQAIDAKLEGIVIFVVGVGDRLLRQEVEDMASSPETIFDAPDFRYLVGMVALLRDNICTAIQETTPPPQTESTTPSRPVIPDLCKECLVEGGVGFNPLPSQCEQYVMCLPTGLTYNPIIKTCPFGMFWSNDAVSCLDARYVSCPYDNCKMMPEQSTFQPKTTGCRGYWRCSGSRSTAMCCEAGFRYQDGVGCRFDAACRDPCPLNVTIHNQGACRYRPDPDTYYGYLEVVPGQGHVKRSCQPGQVYDDKSCSCTYRAGEVIPELACTPSVNLSFNGNFGGSNRQPMDVHQVSLTNRGTAYFDGRGYITWSGSANKEMGSNFLLRLKYRMKGDMNSQGNAWNKNWGWGFENWFRNSSNHGSGHRVTIGNEAVKTPDSGLKGKTLEVISITRNGTVVRDPRYNVRVEASWPSRPLPKVDSLQLGRMSRITRPTFDDGTVYIPNGRNSILIQEPSGRTSSGVAVGQRWKVIAVGRDGSTGRVVESGEGTVPLSIQGKYQFNLKPTLSQHWFIAEPQGVVLEEGSGAMPKEVRDRYAGFADGTLIRVFMSGEGKVEKWQTSRPDGSQLQDGNGDLPVSITSKYNLTSYLTPRQITKMWSVVKNDGTVLESGQGNLPASIMDKYKSLQSVTMFSSSKGVGMDSFWQMVRPSGDKVLEGRGSVPSGILRTIKGNLFPAQAAMVKQWTVTMPDGTVRSGTGEIPQQILDLFSRMTGSVSGLDGRGGSVSTKQTWSVTMPDGSVRTGQGEIPPELQLLMASQGASIQKQWRVRMPDGTVRSGTGEMPADLQGMMGVRRNKRASHTGQHPVMDILANCGKSQAELPSMHLYTSQHQVSFTLKTDTVPQGVTVSLPVHQGMNDVTFLYDGMHLTGMANGIERKMRLAGPIKTSVAPVQVGKCDFRPQNTFHGEIDMIHMYHCLP